MRTIVCGLALLLAGCSQILGISDVRPRVDDAAEADASDEVADAPSGDASTADASAPDASVADASTIDARPPDARVFDARVDAAPPDAPCMCPLYYATYCDFNGCRCRCNNSFECGTQEMACQ